MTSLGLQIMMSLGITNYDVIGITIYDIIRDYDIGEFWNIHYSSSMYRIDSETQFLSCL